MNTMMMVFSISIAAIVIVAMLYLSLQKEETKKNRINRLFKSIDSLNYSDWETNWNNGLIRIQEEFPEFYKAVKYYGGVFSGSIVYDFASAKDIDVLFTSYVRSQKFRNFLSKFFITSIDVMGEKEESYKGRIQKYRVVIGQREAIGIGKREIDVSLVEKIFSPLELLKFKEMEKMRNLFQKNRKNFLEIKFQENVFKENIFVGGEMVPSYKKEIIKKNFYSENEYKNFLKENSDLEVVEASTSIKK